MIFFKKLNIRKTKPIFMILLVFALVASLITGSTWTVSAASSELSAYTVDGLTPLGTTVNLFDYYNYVDSKNVIAGTNTTTDGQTSSYYLSDYNNNSYTSYINSGHQLKFSTGGYGSLNSWTGNASVRSGIVANTLSNGYPTLTDNNNITVDDSNTKLKSESLAYLFDSSEVSGKISYNNVDGLFQINNGGYYYYDSTNNYAEYDEDTNSFVLYDDTWGVAAEGNSPDGQFFPFTSASDVFTISNGQLTQNGIKSKNEKINHYLGLSMSTRFVQENEGHVDSSDEAKEMTYEFKGDDDVWIYIDGVLVGDLGGIHDAASVSINFATGVVVINKGTSYASTTSLYELYKAAGLENTTAWKTVTVNGQTYTIFDDDTYHELDFFYLERGNTDSNLYLMFNLITVPENQIIKLDEDGNAVKGAEFALYEANDATDSDGNVTLTKASEDPLWTGTTDSNGELVLIDSQNKLINFTTLYEENEYEYYILEETSAPSGYRMTEPMWLHYVAATSGSVTAGLLESMNHFETGSYAQAKLHVTAPGHLDNRGKGLLDYDGNSINNAYDSSGNLNGSLFAVVLKRAGAGDIESDTWYPVSGDVTSGFTLGNAVTISSGITNDMLVAAHQFSLGANGLYQLELDNLPGEIDSYYYVISAQGGDVEDAQYTVAYYYMDENGNATLLQEDQFERDYATSFYISDIQNELIVQKVDQDGNPVNGAEFTLYNADDVTINTDGKYTIATDASAVATLTTSTLTEENDGIALEGGGIFNHLANGSYYVIETKAPEGYAINSEIIKVYVDNTGVYANAGDSDDGVDVILSVDSLVKTMSQFATNDDIDQTLAYILAQLSINDTTDEISSSFTDSGDAVALNYSKTDAGNYVATVSSASYPFIVDSGWSSINISQNTELLETLNVNYTEVDNSLDHLYSIDTILRVTDNKVADLAITKSVNVKEGLESILSSLQDIEFTFNVQLLDSDGNALEGTYTVEIYDEYDHLVSNTDTIINGSGNITLKDGQTAIIKDVITGSTYIVQEEEANKDYDTSITVDYDTDASIGVVEDETLKQLIDPDAVVGYTGTVIGIVDDVDNTETENTEIITVNYTNVYDAISKEVDITFDSNGSTSNNASGTTVGVGDVLTYNIEWNNYKNETADITVKDIIPEGTTYVYGSATDTDNLKFYNANDEEITVTQDIVSSVSYLVWTFNNVNAGASGTVSFDVVVNDTAVDNNNNEISNLAEIVVGDDPVVTNTVTNTVPEKTVTDADDNDIDGKYPYVVDKTSDSDTGYRLNYTIYYTNSESDTATVTISDELSEYVTYISGSSYDQNGTNVEPTTSTENGITTLTWIIEDVEAGASGYVTFRVAVNADVVNTIENTGTVTIGNNPSVSTNTVTNTVPEPVKDVLDVNGTSIDGNKVAVGDELTYTIDYTNTSDETEEVVITDGAPSGTTYVDDSAKVYVEGTEVTTDDAVKVANGTITWTVSLDAGESVQAVFKVTVNEGTEGSSIVNDATVVANDYEIKTNTVTNDVPDADKTTTADIEAKKVLENKDLTEEFSFTLKDSDGNEIETVSNDENGIIKFTTLENLKVGEYNYTITENIPDNAENNILNGIHYDSTIWNVKVVVSVDETTNALVSKVTYAKGNDEYSDSLAIFTNIYSSSPATDTLTATKTLYGKELTEGTFTFKLTGSESAPLPEGYDSTNGVTNDSTGSITFGTITFESKGTYVYEISEVNDNQTGYIYDGRTYTVTYVVEDDGNGSLGIISKTVTVNDEEVDSIAFENSYQPLEVSTDTTIGGLKDVDIIDGTFELEAGQFTFALTNVNTGEVVQTVQNDANGHYSFEALTFTEAGEYTYKVAESSSNITGISDDSNYYTITFTVEDQDGQLVITKTIISDANDKTVDSLGNLNFTNTYNPTKITYSINGIKVISNTDTSTDRQVKDGEFTFELTAEGEAPLPVNTVVKNDANGNISFGEMTFTQTGTYTYYVKEIAGNDSTISYDETIYTIVITITDIDGYLSASADIANENIVFTNSYTPTEVVVGPSGKVNISGSKSYIDENSNALDITDGQFSFVLVDSNNETISTAKTNSDGTFVFDDITYDTVGIYRYTVKEVGSTSYDGITYDATVYDVIVNVTEDTEANALVATVTYMLDGENVDSMSFVNSYSTTPAIIHLVGTKVYTGATLNEGQFTYQLLDSDNNVIITVTNGANGTIDFGTLTYNEVGTYIYTISEINDNQENVIYDDSIYKVEVVVSDNGLGELIANVSYSVDTKEKATVIFENTYQEPEEPSITTTTPEETTPTPTEVKTGDESSYELWMSMMGLAIVGLGYIYYRKKRYNA